MISSTSLLPQSKLKYTSECVGGWRNMKEILISSSLLCKFYCLVRNDSS